MPTEPASVRDPLAAVASTASIGFREPIDRAELDAILGGGDVPDGRIGHIMRIVDETPLEMLTWAVMAYEPEQRNRALDSLRRLDAAYGATGRIGRWMTG